MPGVRNMRMRGILAASMFAVLASSNVAGAAPVGSTVQAGTAAISSASNGPGTTTTIDQTSDKAYIDWTSFDIGASDIVNFNQNTIQSIAVNRVTGGLGASAINGALNANGHVWILNPAGIAFGATATVNVGGLLVTTADLDPTAFMNTAVDDAGGFTFTSGGNGTASVSNAGTINSGGLLALVAPFVDNSGTLTSSYGDVLLGGAEAFRISFTQVGRTDPTPFDELLVTDFIIDTPVTNDPTPNAETVPVTNTGSITGGNVIATAASVGGGAFINMDGVVEATSVGTQSGDIVLLAGSDFAGGAADASSGATDKIRVKNADLAAASNLAMQGTDVSIEKGSGPGTITAGAARIDATSGDVTSDAAIATTTGAINIQAFNLASLGGLDAKTTLDVTAKDIDLAGKLAAVGKITLDATDAAKNISGTDIDIEGGSVELTGPVVATDSATIKAATGDVTLNDDLTSSGTTTGSILIEAKSGKATTAGLDATATTASGATIDVTADDVVTNGAVRGDGAVTLTAETGDLLTHGAVTGASVDMEATLGDVVADDTITSTVDTVVIDAVAGLADLHAVDATTTLDVTAKDIDLAGKLAAVGKITLDATDATKNISGTDIDIEGGSVELSGPVVATDSATIKAATGDVTVNDDLTSTGSILINALLGKGSVKGVDATTTAGITAKEIDLDGLVNGDTSVTLDATDVTKDISGTDINITGGSVDLTGKIVATDSATIKALTGDATINDDLSVSGTTTGAVLIEAKSGKATTAGLDATSTTASGATIDVTADDVVTNGAVRGDGAVTLTAETGDLLTHDTVTGASVDMEATLGDVVAEDTITSTLGAVGINAVAGLADIQAVDARTTLDVTADDIDLAGKLAAGGKITLDATGVDISGTDIDIEGGSVELSGPVVATDSATIKTATGDVTLNNDITSTGSILIDALLGKASVKGVDADTTTGITAKEIDLDGLVNGDTSVTLDATDATKDISGTAINITGGSVDLTGKVVATDSATIKALTGDVILNDDLSVSGTTTGSVLIEAKSGNATTAGLDATATTASGATIDVTADDVETNGVVRGDGAVMLTAETGDLLTHGTVTGASVDMEATLGDVVADDTVTSTVGEVGINAVAGLADLHAVDAKTTLDVTAKDIDLTGKLSAVGKITLDATDTTRNISGTDIDIEGSSVELTGSVVATDSATIKASTGDVTLNNDITSTGSILIDALLGKASVKGVDADTTTGIIAKEIDLDGLVNGDTSVTLNATDATKDISGTDINITGGSVDLTGKVVATDSATIEATTTDVTLNDDLTSTGSVLIKALLGKVTAAGLSAVTTLEVYAKEIMISGDAIAGGDVTIRASDGDATLSGNTESTGGNVDVEANLGTASVFGVASHLATTVTGGVVKVLGDLVSNGQATLQALTGNVDIAGSVTANGGLLLLNAAQGDAVINKIASTTNVSIQALDLDLSGSISAGDEVILTSLDSGTTIVLGGDGGVGSISLRKPQGLTIDAGELGRISAGDLKIDAVGNDALLRSVDFSGATLGNLSIGASSSSWIMTDGIVTGLNSLTLGYVDGLLDRRPELVLIGGSLGLDSPGGSDWLGNVVVNSSQDIIIGSQTFKTYYDTINPTLSQLGSLNPGLVGVFSNHVFIATSNLELYAPGDIIQLNTGSGVDGKGLVFKTSAVGKAVLNPSGMGPDKAVLFGVVVRDDGTRVTSFSAGLEPRLLYEGEKDNNGKVISDPLTQTGDYHFNLCIIGDPVSCSNALLRQAEGTSAAAMTDPNPNILASGLTFDTGDNEDDDDDDTSGVAATGNESLWGAATQ